MVNINHEMFRNIYFFNATNMHSKVDAILIMDTYHPFWYNDVYLYKKVERVKVISVWSAREVRNTLSWWNVTCFRSKSISSTFPLFSVTIWSSLFSLKWQNRWSCGSKVWTQRREFSQRHGMKKLEGVGQRTLLGRWRKRGWHNIGM